jgi:hypothetical protein
VHHKAFGVRPTESGVPPGTFDSGDQPMAIQGGVDGAAGRHLHFRRQAPQQTFAVSAKAPVELPANGRNALVLAALIPASARI